MYTEPPTALSVAAGEHSTRDGHWEGGRWRLAPVRYTHTCIPAHHAHSLLRRVFAHDRMHMSPALPARRVHLKQGSGRGGQGTS
eukprot:1747841-Rhodomonas_salina.1